MQQRIQYQKCGSRQTAHASVREPCWWVQRRHKNVRLAPAMRRSCQLQRLPRGWNSSSFLLSIGQGCRGVVSAVGTFGSDPWAAFLRTIFFFRWGVSIAAALTYDQTLEPLHLALNLF